MDGGRFLPRPARRHIEHDGRTIRGLEVIGHEKPFGGEPGDDIRSRFYDNAANTLTGGWTWPGGGYDTVATRTG